MKSVKKLPVVLSFLFCSMTASAQGKPFDEWDATAYCSYSRYHPFSYIRVDNNWEILQALSDWHPRAYLDSLGIRNTASQMMLLKIEGLVEQDGRRLWRSTIPLLDSLQTIAARDYSKRIAERLYPGLRPECEALVGYLDAQNQADHAYSILFSYVFDGKVWDAFYAHEELNSGATWEGACWALYFSRPFSCGTNTYDDTFVLNWTDGQPDFIWEELNNEIFIQPFLREYREHGKIVSAELLKKAQDLGFVDAKGILLIPVIDGADGASRLNILADSIVRTIFEEFKHSDFVPVFQEKFGVAGEKPATVMLYHEVMWDLMDLLTRDGVIRRPAVWSDPEKRLTASVVYLLK